MSTLVIGGERIELSVNPGRGRVRYAARVPVPGFEERVRLRIDITINRRAWTPAVTAAVPECLRHRYTDGALCMWWQPDPATRRWTLDDGIALLIQHIRQHLYQEACCRAGEPWPGEEAPGDHPRPSACRTCGGEGP